MTEPWIAHWTSGSELSAGLITLKWALLLAAAALAGHLSQRLLGLPKLVGYAVFGTLAGLTGLAGADWPLQGAGLTLVELGVAMLLFEAGARLIGRARANPVVGSPCQSGVDDPDCAHGRPLSQPDKDYENVISILFPGKVQLRTNDAPFNCYHERMIRS